ncbi:hypothetical protein PIB30_001369 [Stylosanthes scabra]|uniref:DYW domain-containing protein n=1 Tax=Stylosanthes scabra TaxID=79078 RepID=A0ABU6Y0Y4_9FABA|nr:hypothetical protein [Stylosanthes scabra]
MRSASILSPSTASLSQWFSLLRHAIATSDLLLGKRGHALIITSGHHRDPFLANNLITMYGKCGSLSCARHLFDVTPHRDLVTWNAILSAYAQAGDADNANTQEGFRLFRVLRESFVLTTRHTLAPVFKLCLLSGCEWASQVIHGYAVKIGLEWDVDVVLWNVMIKAYVEMGLQDEALILFSAFHRSGLCPDDVTVRSVLMGVSRTGFELLLKQVRAYASKLFLLDHDWEVVVWNKTLSDYLQAGETREAIECFMDMIKLRVPYDNMTLLIMLSVAANEKNINMGKQIHNVVVKSESDQVVSVANSLLNMYMKAGSVDYAKILFSQMKEKDLISWNTIISGCALGGSVELSISFFVNLLRSCLSPDQFTIASVLRGCSSFKEGFYLIRQIHTFAIKAGIIYDPFVSTSLIDVYSKSGKMEEAELLFSTHDGFDLASWNAMMHGYITSKCYHKALELFIQMHGRGEQGNQITLANAAKAAGCLVGLEQGKQLHAIAIKRIFNIDLFVISGILDMYLKCGEMESACKVFSKIPSPDDVAWTTMISGCVDNGYEEHALFTYHHMRLSGVQLDEYTFATLVKASSLLTALEQGRQIHANVIKLNCALDPFVMTSLVDMYAKCGNIEDAYRLFKKMNTKSIASWNAMIVGLAQHGNAQEALNLFKDMKSQGEIPDRVTFIGVLSACSHSGLISEAYENFYSMQRDHKIEPEIEHYSCLVDALSRAGRIQEAEKVISSMPFEASASIYRTLLNACRVQGDKEKGKNVAERLLTLEPSDSDPGFSWVDIKNKVHMFVAGDRSHEEADLIYNKVDYIMKRIKEEGYVPDTDFALVDIEEEEKESALYYHSEKLAIAYGILRTPPSAPLRVIKNLRVCGDCHNAIKYMSKVFQREIVVRDANRFHHFRNGICSCSDYW